MNKNSMQNPEMDIIVFSNEDVIATSGERTHKNGDELSSYGLGGFFNSSNWYKNHQN